VHPEPTRQRAGFVSSYLAVLLTGMMLGVGAPNAAADPPASCVNHLWNTGGTDAGAAGNQQGIKSDMAIFAFASDCDRVSSLFVQSPGGGSAEVGWVNGWTKNGGNAYTGTGACDGQYWTHPHLFITWVPEGGSYHCRVFGSVDVGFGVFSTADSNSDGTWQFSQGGSIVDSHAMNFDRGYVITNGERHNQTIDTAKAHFKDLQKQVASNGNTWFDFCCSENFPPDPTFNDPDFHWEKEPGTQTETWVLHD
jgi:hypothetical protein